LGDSRLEACHGHFESDVRDIVAAAAASGARTVLCTVPVNLRSCAPFGSRHKDGLADGELAEWQTLFDEGRRLQRAGNPAEAATKYAAAAAIDDAHAELAYCMAQCAEQAGDAKGAAILYRRALDLDTLRFRADSRINAILRETAEATDAHLLDLERALEAHAKKSILGDGLLLDHVHLNFRGNALAAIAAAKVLGGALPQLAREAPGTEDAIIERLRRRLLYDARAEYDIALLMYRRKTRPPFIEQPDHDREMALLRSGVIELRHAVVRQNLARSEDEHIAVVREAPDDPLVLRRLGDFLVRHARADEAVRRYRQRLETTPHCSVTREGLAVTLTRLGEFDEAVELLTGPANPFAMAPGRALSYLGTTLIERGRAMESEELFLRVHELNDEDVGALTNLGAAASGRGRPEEAAELLTRALAIDPRFVDAMVNLANTHVKRNHRADALEWFRKAVEENPYHVTAQCGLGLELTRHGKMKEGIEHVRRSVELNPAFVAGYRLLASFYKMQGSHTLARDYAELASLFAVD
jgi:tetratricopeptide (TPR) repeat protein